MQKFRQFGTAHVSIISRHYRGKLICLREPIAQPIVGQVTVGYNESRVFELQQQASNRCWTPRRVVFRFLFLNRYLSRRRAQLRINTYVSWYREKARGKSTRGTWEIRDLLYGWFHDFDWVFFLFSLTISRYCEKARGKSTRDIKEIRGLLYGWFCDFDQVFNDISIRRG